MRKTRQPLYDIADPIDISSLCIYMYLYLLRYACICTYICVHIYIYIYIHGEGLQLEMFLTGINHEGILSDFSSSEATV